MSLIPNLCLLLAVVNAAYFVDAIPATFPHGREPSARIYWGDVAPPKTYRFMAFLQTPLPGLKPGQVEQCGGTVISKTCILTAAHCLTDHQTAKVTPDNSVYAILGSNTPQKGKLYKSSKVHVHEDYKPPGSMLNDIAIVIVDKEIAPSDAEQVTLAQSTPDDGYADQKVLLLGWGTTETGTTSDVLRTGDVTLQNHHECSSLKFSSKQEQQSRLCANVHSGQGFVEFGKGDSGGPIVKKNKKGRFVQLGLVSQDVNQTYSATEVVRNDVYTAVGFFYPWIKKHCPDFMG